MITQQLDFIMNGDLRSSDGEDGIHFPMLLLKTILFTIMAPLGINLDGVTESVFRNNLSL